MLGSIPPVTILPSGIWYFFLLGGLSPVPSNGKGDNSSPGTPFYLSYVCMCNELKRWKYLAFSHDVTKIQTTNYWSSFTSMMHEISWRLKFLQIFSPNGFLILPDYAWICHSKLLRDVAFTWWLRELSCWLKKWLISGNLYSGPKGPFGYVNISCIRKSVILVFLTWLLLQFLDYIECSWSILF